MYVAVGNDFKNAQQTNTHPDTTGDSTPQTGTSPSRVNSVKPRTGREKSHLSHLKPHIINFWQNVYFRPLRAKNDFSVYYFNFTSFSSMNLQLDNN